MKALSIKQPYAGLIIAGIKNVENRSWAPKGAPGTLVIVSTATPDAKKWWAPMREKCATLGVTFPEALCAINGAALGLVECNYGIWQAEDGTVKTDHPTIDKETLYKWWIPDMLGWIMDHPRRLAVPVPVIGRLGIYKLSEEVEAQITRQLRENS